MSEKFGKIKSSVPKKIERIVLWIIIFFLIFRGIVSIIRPNQSKKILDQVNSELNNGKNTTASLNEAAAFAECFSKEFFTYRQSEGDEYRKRLSNYMTDVAISSINSSLNGDVQALDAVSLYKNRYGKNGFNIDVMVKIRYSKGLTKDIFIRVPVATENGKYVVEDTPLFIARPELAHIESSQYDGNIVDTSISEPIEDMLNNFFKVYCEGNKGEIRYYLNDPSKNLGGLDGQFKFKNITELRVYNKDKDYLALVSFLLEDVETKQEIKQKIHMVITNKENRYYIKDLQTRIVNIDEGVK